MAFVNVLAFVIIIIISSIVCVGAEVVTDCLDKTAESHSDDYDPSARGRINALSASELLRGKRAFVYPPASTLLLIFGLGTPLQLDRESVIVGAFAKFIYALPSNSSELVQPGIVYGRDKILGISRWSIYRSLAKLLEFYNLGEGRTCILRAICEAASTPFDHKQGLLHRLLQTFLSPSSTSERHDDYQDREYEAAERLGRHVGENCHALYPECRTSFLDIFSVVRTMLFPKSLR